MKELLKLFTAFFKMGLFTFGGGLAMLPLIQRTAVEEKQWMTKEEMVDCVAVSQSMPGVIAVNAATYIGNHRRGTLGAIAATLGVVMPSFIIIILAVIILGTIGENSYVEGAFVGVKAASCGLILYAAYSLGRQILKGFFPWMIAILAFGMTIFLKVTALWAIVLGAVVGLVYSQCKNRKKQEKEEEQ